MAQAHQPAFSTCSVSSNASVSNQMEQAFIAPNSLLKDGTVHLNSTMPVSPRSANTSLPLRQRHSNTSSKRPANDETCSNRAVRTKIASSMGSWTFVEKESESTVPRNHIKSISKRRAHRVRFEIYDDNVNTNTVVEDGTDSSTPETSKRSSNLLVIDSLDSEVIDSPMIRPDVSMARTRPTKSNAAIDLDVARLAAETMSAALVGIGTQFMHPASYNDWIFV